MLVRKPRGSISSYNIAGLISEISEEVATQIAKNCRRRQPHSHYIAKRVFQLHVVRLSGRPSVCDVGGSEPHRLAWKSWKIIAWTISSTSSLFLAQRPSTYSQGNTGEILKRLEVGLESVALEHKSGNISVTPKDREKVTVEGL